MKAATTIAQIRITAPAGSLLPAGIRVEVRNYEGQKLATWQAALSTGELVVQLGPARSKSNGSAGTPHPMIGGGARLGVNGRKPGSKKPGPPPDPALRARNSHALARYLAGDPLIDIAKEAACSPSGIFEAIRRLAIRENIQFTPRSQRGPR